MLFRSLKMHIYSDYNGAGKLQYIMSANEINVIDTIYTDNVEIIAPIPVEMYHMIENKVLEATSASAVIENEGEIWYGVLKDGSVHIF